MVLRYPDNPYARSSMLVWYENIKDLDIPQPTTRIVNIPNKRFSEMFDGDSTLSAYSDEFSSAMNSLGPFPIFLRTDNSSQKHSFRKTCRLPNEKSLLGHILELVDSNMACDMTDNAIIFREWLDLEAGFWAFDGLPISVEARVFVNHGKVQCIHPYWPENAIGSWAERHAILDDAIESKMFRINPSWKTILKSQNKIVTESYEILKRYSKMVIDVIGDDHWSVDFAFGRDGKWYLIDMAAGEVSYHDSACALSEKNNQIKSESPKI